MDDDREGRPPPCNCLKCWDQFQSKEGRDRVRNVLAPLGLSIALVFLVIGATWARFIEPQCGTTLSTAQFSVKSSGPATRVLVGNGCPGYDWLVKGASAQRETAGQYPFTYKLSLRPVLVARPFFVGRTNSVEGPIGVALNGVALWGPSASGGADTVASEAATYDQCGGMSTPPNNFAFSAPITGHYRYRWQPGRSSSSSTASAALCPAVLAWYNESTTRHSPLLGFMADGIPIYGPYTANAREPVDLDVCGGHASDAVPFYHYHVRSAYPYTVECLRGCLDGSVNPALNNLPCVANNTLLVAAPGMSGGMPSPLPSGPPTATPTATPPPTTKPTTSPTEQPRRPTTKPTVAATKGAAPAPSPAPAVSVRQPPRPAATTNYTALARLAVTYGGKGGNQQNWGGPGSLLAFGFLFFIPSLVGLGCMCCQYQHRCCKCDGQDPGVAVLAADGTWVVNPIAAHEQEIRYDEFANDNVL